MKPCKVCKNLFEPYIRNGIKASRCNLCLFRQKTGKAKKDNTGLPELLKLADIIFSRYIRKRDRGRCITCGTIKPWKEMQNGHYIPRRHMLVRFDEMNCNAQCQNCNEVKSGAIEQYREALIEKYGIDSVLHLESKKDRIKKFTAQELHAILYKYKNKTKEVCQK